MPEKILKTIKPREYQQKIFDTCKDKNCLVVLPTGTGKTLIALMLSISRLRLYPESKVLFLAPTRPLAEQHLSYFQKHLPELFATKELFTGKIDAEKRKKLWQNAEIIFSTPQCVSGETIIFTKEGPEKISEFFKKFDLKEKEYRNEKVKEAEIQEKILGYNWEKICFLNASKAFKFPPREIVEIQTEIGNQLICTKEHPVLTINKEGELSWKEASLINKGDYIASAKEIEIKENPLNILELLLENKHLRIYDKLIVKKLIKKLKENKIKCSPYSRYLYNFMPLNIFIELSKKLNFNYDELLITDNCGKSSPVKIPENLDSKLAYIIGAMLGDGHLGNRKGHGSEVVFSDLDRKSVAGKFKKLMEEIFGVKMKEDRVKGLIAYNSALTSVLASLGVPQGRKSKIIRVPKFIFFSNTEVIDGFISGIFDTDGHASKYGVSISSTSESFIQDLKWLFLRIGIIGRIEKRESHGIIRSRILKESEIFTFRFSGRRNLERFLKTYPNEEKCKKLKETIETTKKPYTRAKEILPVPELMKRIRKENKNKEEYYKFSCLSTDNLSRLLKKLDGENSERLKILLNMPIRWVKVKDTKERKDKEEVYDLTIDKNHNFIANHMISHNCVANDLRNNLYGLKEVSLLIEDECHRCLKNYDYTSIAENYKKNAQHQRILGLTASPGADKATIKKISNNLGIEAIEIRTRESDDVKSYLQELKFQTIKLDFPEEFKEIRNLLLEIHNKKIEEIKNRKLLFGPPTKKNILDLQRKIMTMISTGNRHFNILSGASACAQVIKLQYCLELLETQTLSSLQRYMQDLFEQARQSKTKAVKQLIKQPSFNQAYIKTTELIAKKVENPKLLVLKEIVEQEMKGKIKRIIVFSQYRETVTKICKTLNEILGVNAMVFVGQLKKGDTGLSQKEQRAVIEDFTLGKVNILCSTSVHPDEYIILKKENEVMIKKIGEFVCNFIKENKKQTISERISGWEALTSDGKNMLFKPITHVHKHRTQNKVINIKSRSGFDCKITENHSLFSFDEENIFTPTIPEKNKFVALTLKCPNIEENEKIDVIKELYQNCSKEEKKNLFGSLEGLTQSRIRMLKTDYQILAAMEKDEENVMNLSKLTKKDYSTITCCLKRLKEKGFINQKRVKKCYQNVSTISEKGVEYYKFLDWFFNNVKYEKGKYKFSILDNKTNGIEFNKFFEQNINVSYGKTKFRRFIEVDKNLARFLGFYVSEGSTRKTKYTSDVFLAARNKKMQKLMKDSIENGLKLKTRTNKYGIAIDSQIAYYLIKEVFRAGIGAYNKEVPEIIFTSQDKVKWEFLRAYFLGDGYLGKDKIVLTTVSRKLVTGIVLLLRMLEIEKISIFKQKNIYRINISESLPFAKINTKNEERRHAYYSLIPTAISSDKAFAKYNNYYSPSNKYLKSRKNGKWNTDVCYDYINKIEEIKKPEYVYDLSIKDTENFIGGTGLFCLHNSIGEEGLDIPEVGAVIFYEPIPSAIRQIQRRGRTARLKPGKLLILMIKNTRDEAYYWAAFNKEKRMHSAIDSIKEELENKEKKNNEDKKESGERDKQERLF